LCFPARAGSGVMARISFHVAPPAPPLLENFLFRFTFFPGQAFGIVQDYWTISTAMEVYVIVT
jgi:hypothetical protein